MSGKDRPYHQPVYAPPEGACDILLIRHGESEAIRPGESFPLADGHGDPALHPRGETQAEAVGERLREDTIAAIYVTNLRRTHQTARPLSGHLGITPKVEPALREVFLGEWEGGLYRIKALDGDPVVEEACESHEWGVIPGAESTGALHDRVREALTRIAAAHPDARVAAFVHGGVIGAAMAMATGAPAFTFNGAANGSISRLVVKGPEMSVHGFNDTAHLGGP